MPAGTITTYLEECRDSFAAKPLTEVDSLVLSTVAYFYLEKGMFARRGFSDRLPLPLAIAGVRADDLFGDIWLSRMGGDQFLAALFQSSRFMQVEVGDYVSETSSIDEKQFAAMTFYLPNGTAYVAFRGTDSTLVGWKEDFNLSYMDELPSQASARNYLQRIAARYYGPLYVGGHSKGGNLAEYAVLTCDEGVFARVAGVFSHDGPAFANDPSERMHQDAYRAKLHKTVPESSIVGMLMEKRHDLHVVRADGVLFLQHASTRWMVEDGAFVTADSLTPDAVIITRTLNSWALSYEPEKRELLVNALFEVLGASEAPSWSEWSKDYVGNGRASLEAALKLPPDLRNELLGMLMDIAKVFGGKTLDLMRTLASTPDLLPPR